MWSRRSTLTFCRGINRCMGPIAPPSRKHRLCKYAHCTGQILYYTYLPHAVRLHSESGTAKGLVDLFDSGFPALRNWFVEQIAMVVDAFISQRGDIVVLSRVALLLWMTCPVLRAFRALTVSVTRILRRRSNRLSALVSWKQSTCLRVAYLRYEFEWRNLLLVLIIRRYQICPCIGRSIISIPLLWHSRLSPFWRPKFSLRIGCPKAVRLTSPLNMMEAKFRRYLRYLHINNQGRPVSTT